MLNDECRRMYNLILPGAGQLVLKFWFACFRCRFPGPAQGDSDLAGLAGLTTDFAIFNKCQVSLLQGDTNKVTLNLTNLKTRLQPDTYWLYDVRRYILLTSLSLFPFL